MHAMPHLPRILLVADSPDEREMYATSLQRHGFCTLVAATAADAYRRQTASVRSVPVIVLTGRVFSHDRDAAARAGCDLFVPKPCLPETLSSVVAELIQRRAEPGFLGQTA